MGDKIFLLCFFRALQHLLCENWASLGGGPIFASVPSPSLFLEPQWPHFLPIVVFFNTPPTPVRGPPLIKNAHSPPPPSRKDKKRAGRVPMHNLRNEKGPGRTERGQF